MKLELEHLYRYLPYRLRVSKTHTLNIGTGMGNGIGSISHLLSTSNKIYKPRLYPIESLTIEQTIEFYNLDTITLELIDINEWNQELIHEIKSGKGNFLHWQFEKLFEWHFDVFGLIEKGLAVSIHDF